VWEVIVRGAVHVYVWAILRKCPLQLAADARILQPQNLCAHNHFKPNCTKTHHFTPFCTFLNRGKNPTQALKQESSPKQTQQKTRGDRQNRATVPRECQNINTI